MKPRHIFRPTNFFYQNALPHFKPDVKFIINCRAAKHPLCHIVETSPQFRQKQPSFNQIRPNWLENLSPFELYITNMGKKRVLLTDNRETEQVSDPCPTCTNCTINCAEYAVYPCKFVKAKHWILLRFLEIRFFENKRLCQA